MYLTPIKGESTHFGQVNGEETRHLTFLVFEGILCVFEFFAL